MSQFDFDVCVVGGGGHVGAPREDQPEHALLLSWHIGEELAARLRQLGYRGQFIVPLPTPRIL